MAAIERWLVLRACIEEGRRTVWIISVAQAVGMAASIEPPSISAAARVRMGRMRFPPAIREYRIDS